MSDYAWKKENVRNVGISLNIKTCADVLEMLDKQPSRQAYIIELIRKDIEEKKKAQKAE